MAEKVTNHFVSSEFVQLCNFIPYNSAPECCTKAVEKGAGQNSRF